MTHMGRILSHHQTVSCSCSISRMPEDLNPCAYGCQYCVTRICEQCYSFSINNDTPKWVPTSDEPTTVSINTSSIIEEPPASSDPTQLKQYAAFLKQYESKCINEFEDLDGFMSLECKGDNEHERDMLLLCIPAEVRCLFKNAWSTSAQSQLWQTMFALKIRFEEIMNTTRSHDHEEDYDPVTEFVKHVAFLGVDLLNIICHLEVRYGLYCDAFLQQLQPRTLLQKILRQVCELPRYDYHFNSDLVRYIFCCLFSIFSILGILSIIIYI